MEHEHPADAGLPILRHYFTHTNIRDVSVSAIHPSSSSSPTISFLAYDVMRGLLLYHIHLPTLNVKFIGSYNLSQSVPLSHVRFGNTRAFVSALCLGKEGKRGIWIERGRRNMTRGVIAFEFAYPAWDGVGIQVANDGHHEEATNFHEDNDENLGEADGITSTPTESECWMQKPAIDGRVIYEVASYDLRGECLLLSY
jgi:hypothetical protein